MAERRNGEGNTRHMLPQTINLPELPLVRVQERRGGFESTTSTFDIPSSPIERKNNFEIRRRTNHTTNTVQSFVNDATDQKIPRIIRPIPDEMEEINMKGSISID